MIKIFYMNLIYFNPDSKIDFIDQRFYLRAPSASRTASLNTQQFTYLDAA